MSPGKCRYSGRLGISRDVPRCENQKQDNGCAKQMSSSTCCYHVEFGQVFQPASKRLSSARCPQSRLANQRFRC